MAMQAKFISFFISIHILLLLLLIYKHSLFIQQSFANQKNERTLIALTQKKEALINQLYACKDHDTIKQIAQKTLGMEPISRKQIKHVS